MISGPHHPDSAATTVSFVVDAGSAGLRIDVFLAGQMHWRSRRWLTARLDAGAVALNGAATKKARRLETGDVVSLRVDARAEAPPAPDDPPLRILFEDDDLIVVDKPPHLPVHAASTCQHHNLLSMLQRRDAGRPFSPAVIHRLDRSTTGVIAFARRSALVPFYMAQFEHRRVRKQYTAVVHGIPDACGTIALPLLAVPGRRVVVDGGGKPSTSAWHVIARGHECAMLAVVPETGRKHQIRVHLAAIGHPIVFDDLYGRVHGRTGWPAGCGPQLHAARLELEHTDGRPHLFEAPLPPTMDASMRWVAARAAEDCLGADAAPMIGKWAGLGDGVGSARRWPSPR